MKNFIYSLLPGLRFGHSVWGSIGRRFERLWELITVVCNPSKDSEVRTQPLLENYSADSPMLDVEGKTVIMMIDSHSRGGLADRLKGSTFVYNCVKELNKNGENIKFRINFSYPFVLSNYLAPKGDDWRIVTSDISYNTTQSEVIKIGGRFDRHIESSAQRRFLKNRIVKSKCNQIHVYTNLFDSRIFSKCFNELFKPSPMVQIELDKYVQEFNGGGGYISATFRFQNLLGDFHEGHYPTLDSKDEIDDLIAKSVAQVETLHLKNKTKQILVTADSRTFLDAVKRLPYVVTIDGDLVHMAYTAENTIDLHKKPFVDYLMIAQADEVHLLRTGRMYKSGFPETAALIHNKPFKYIEF